MTFLILVANTEAELDLELAVIDRPDTTEVAGEGFIPECRVYSNAEEDVYGSLYFSISDLATQQLVYTDTVCDQLFEHGYTTVYATKEFIPELNKEYEAYFVVEHPEDVDPINNDLSKTFNAVAGITEEPSTSLDIHYDNPMMVQFNLNQTSNVNLQIYDITGKIIVTLASGTYNAGRHTLNWNTRDTAPGIYFVRFITPEFTATRKVIAIH